MLKFLSEFGWWEWVVMVIVILGCVWYGIWAVCYIIDFIRIKSFRTEVFVLAKKIILFVGGVWVCCFGISILFTICASPFILIAWLMDRYHSVEVVLMPIITCLGYMALVVFILLAVWMLLMIGADFVGKIKE